MKKVTFYGFARDGRPLVFRSHLEIEKRFRRISLNEFLTWAVAVTGILAAGLLAVLAWFPEWLG